MADDQVEQIVNACDAGREGELIFAYVYDLAPVQKPVQRLWLSSMTKTAIREAFGHLRPGRGAAVARGGGPLALRGRLARGHERHARGVDPAAGGVRRRGLARPGADAHAGAGRAPRGGDPQLRAGAVLARRGAVRGHGRAPLRRPLPGRQAAALRGRGAGDRRRRSRARPARSRSSRRRSSASSRSCSTTSRACSGTRTACSASRRAGRSRRPSACTRTTRRSPTRARTRAS